jgi:hypothetical protein
LDDLAARVFGRAANDRGEVRGLGHELTVIDDAKRQDRQRQKSDQQRELDGDSARVSAAL